MENTLSTQKLLRFLVVLSDDYIQPCLLQLPSMAILHFLLKHQEYTITQLYEYYELKAKTQS